MTLGHYRLVEKIGAGGMGEVWRAVNTTLGREVAIKILPAAFASDPERLARFEREAKLLASLNHPNIATVHGFHEAGGVRFLAMELVHGEDLAQRLKTGPLPLAEAADVARQIAEALEAAHEQGVVHRDLKPANVKLTPDGRVKVFDFGLAKAADAGPAAARDTGVSPTITSLGTVAGVILGTAAYMSPEQARGKPVNKRANVWAFGCVLFEMIVGARPFDGETVSDTLAAILAKDPDWNAFPPAVPSRLRELIGRCLEKDPRRRLRDIGDARIELENALASRTTSGHLRTPVETATAPVAARPARRAPLGVMTALAVLAAAVAAWALFRPATATAPARLMRLRVERPSGESTTGPGTFALAPDGGAVVFVVNGGTNVTHLWLRDLGDVGGHDLSGTENATFPFWSPDSRHIAFFADGKLKRIPRSGGGVQTVCEAPNGRGGAWSATGVIVFAPNPFDGLFKVVPNGGTPEPLTKLDATRNQVSHRFPTFLPDGRTFVYAVQPALQPNLVQNEIASLDDPTGRPLLLGRNAARYAPPGYMVFPRDLALVAQRIDLTANEMTGDIVQLSERAAVVERVVATPAIATASDGTIVYDEPDRRATDGVWYSRDGRPMSRAFRHAGRIYAADMSPRGDRLVIAARSEKGDTAAIVSLADGNESRLIREDRLPRSVIWSPADDRIIANIIESGNPSIISLDPSGGDEQRLLALHNRWINTTSARFDRSIVFEDMFSGQGVNLVYLPGGAAETKIYLASPANEQGGVLSPDGNLIAYTSDASGRSEVYVDAFPEHRQALRVSTDGAAVSSLRWRGDGRELYFVSADGRSLVASDVTFSPAFVVGKPHELFELPAEAIASIPAPQGDRFLLFIPVGEPRTSLTLVQNWSGQLRSEE